MSEEDDTPQKYGAVDRVYDGIVEATFNISDGPLYVSDFVAGVYDGTNFPTAFGEGLIRWRLGKDPETPKETYCLSNKAFPNIDVEFDTGLGWWEQNAGKAYMWGEVVGGLGPLIAAGISKEPAFLLPYTTNVTNGLNYIDRNHITGKYDNWEEVDEAIEVAYDEAKEAVSEGIELLGNARDNIIRDTRTFMRNTRSWTEHLASDEYLDIQDPEIEEFWHAARQLEKHGEITGIEYAYNAHPEELEVREIKGQINSMINEEYLRVTPEDFIIEKVKGENGNPRKPGKTYNLRIDAEVDINDTDSEVEREPDWTDTEIFELSVSWPADYPDPSLFGSEEDEEESFGEREPELARE